MLFYGITLNFHGKGGPELFEVLEGKGARKNLRFFFCIATSLQLLVNGLLDTYMEIVEVSKCSRISYYVLLFWLRVNLFGRLSHVNKIIMVC